MDEQRILREQAEQVAKSGALGRSRSYARLLEFLVACAIDGRTPKELEIAMNVFGKGADFDPSQDSLVRVYAHNLRQKLEHYYATQGRNERWQIALARGEYRLMTSARAEPEHAGLAPARVDDTPVAAPAAAPGEAPASGTLASTPDALAAPSLPPMVPAPRRAPWLLAAGAAALLAGGIAIGITFEKEVVVGPPAPAAEVAASPVWSELFDDDLPVLVVVGDYFILGEVNDDGDVNRLVRDFAVNSSKDLDERYMEDPDAYGSYIDLGLTYLPRGSGFALLDLLRVVYSGGKQNVRLVSVSELNVADLRTNHVIYVGFVSGLAKLEEFVFASSGLKVGPSYDELEVRETGQPFSSEAGFAAQDRSYTDYALVSTFPGPGGNQVLIVAGTRDEGLMQAAFALSDPMFVSDLEKHRPDSGLGEDPAFEMLFEVTGYAQTNLDAMPVYKARLDYQKIWGGQRLTQRSR